MYVHMCKHTYHAPVWTQTHILYVRKQMETLGRDICKVSMHFACALTLAAD